MWGSSIWCTLQLVWPRTLSLLMLCRAITVLRATYKNLRLYMYVCMYLRELTWKNSVTTFVKRLPRDFHDIDKIVVRETRSMGIKLVETLFHSRNIIQLARVHFYRRFHVGSNDRLYIEVTYRTNMQYVLKIAAPEVSHDTLQFEEFSMYRNLFPVLLNYAKSTFLF